MPQDSSPINETSPQLAPPGLFSFITTPQIISKGVSSFRSPRFFMILLLYLGGVILLARDTFFIRAGAFAWNQSLLVVLLAFMIISTINWELMLTGKPSGANLLLQLLLIIPFTIFIARLLGEQAPPEHTNLVNELLEVVKNVRDCTLPPFLIKPMEWIASIFNNIWLILLIIILETALCLKKRALKVAVIVLFVFLIFGYSLSDGRPKLSFFLGSLLLFTGFAFHYCDYAKLTFFENLARHLPSDGDALLYQAILKIMSAIYENEKIEERSFIQHIKSVYSSLGYYSEGDIRLIASEINRKMLYEYSLITIHATPNGYFAIPNPKLYHCSSNLKMISVLPRVTVVLILSVLWIASPIDVIPDFLPFGGLDDVIVALLSTFVAKHSLPHSSSSSDD